MGATAGGLGRREFLGVAVAGTLLGPVVRADEPPRAPGLPGVITRQKSPDNLEYPYWTLDRFLTPDEQFYVRTHFEVPTLDAKAWKLKVEGAVETPFEIGYDDLVKIPAHTLPALLECSGNGRVFLKPPQVGIRWDAGRGQHRRVDRGAAVRRARTGRAEEGGGRGDPRRGRTGASSSRRTRRRPG